MSTLRHGHQDYQCPECGAIEENLRADWVPVPEDRRLYKGQEEKLPLYCSNCHLAGKRVELKWLPTQAQNDLTSGGTGLLVDLGGDTPHRFDSFREMHTYARESQKRAEGGEGQAISFRALHQTSQNMSRNTLAGSSLERNRQVPHAQIGRTLRGRRISGEILTKRDAERQYGQS